MIKTGTINFSSHVLVWGYKLDTELKTLRLHPGVDTGNYTKYTFEEIVRGFEDAPKSWDKMHRLIAEFLHFEVTINTN